MWKPQPLTTLRASKARRGENFTFLHFTSRPTSLLASIKICVFYGIDIIMSRDSSVGIVTGDSEIGGGVVSFTPRPLYPRGRSPGTHWIGGWLYPRGGLEEVEKRKLWTLSRLELRPLGRPARSQSLNRLRYPGSLPTVYRIKKVKKQQRFEKDCRAIDR
jgi:hypothetical protein